MRGAVRSGDLSQEAGVELRLLALQGGGEGLIPPVDVVRLRRDEVHAPGPSVRQGGRHSVIPGVIDQAREQGASEAEAALLHAVLRCLRCVVLSHGDQCNQLHPLKRVKRLHLFKPSVIMAPMNDERMSLTGMTWPPSLRTDYGHGSGPSGACLHATVYDLTCAQYEEMRDRARDCCELCSTPGPRTARGALVIDHFEAPGVRFVRGLLCDRCNALMARHDGTAPWGPSTQARAEAARRYHLAAYGRPTAEELSRADTVIAERTRALAARFEPAVRREPVPVQPELRAIAQDLRSRLTGSQLCQLAALLCEPPFPPSAH